MICWGWSDMDVRWHQAWMLVWPFGCLSCLLDEELDPMLDFSCVEVLSMAELPNGQPCGVEKRKAPA